MNVFPDVAGPPFIRAMRNLTAITGSDFRLHCPVSGYPIEAVHIEKGEQMQLNYQSFIYDNKDMIIIKKKNKL